MSILFLGSSPSDLGGGSIANTGTKARDPALTPVGIRVDYPMEGNGFAVSFPPASSDVWIHFLVHTSLKFGTNNSYDDGYWLRLFNGSTELFRIDVENGNFTLQGGTATPLTLVVGPDTEYTVDFKLTSDGTTVSAELFFGGVSQGSISYASSSGPVDRITFDHFDMSNDESTYYGSIGDGIGSIYYSEFIVTDGEPTLGWRLNSLTPAANGFHNDWNGDFNGVVEFGDGQGISSDIVGAKQSWSLSAYGGPPTAGGVRAVVTKFLGSKGNRGPQTIVPLVRAGGTDYEGTAITTGEGTFLSVMDVNPSTGLPWDTADLALTEFGVKAGA